MPRRSRRRRAALPLSHGTTRRTSRAPCSGFRLRGVFRVLRCVCCVCLRVRCGSFDRAKISQQRATELGRSDGAAQGVRSLRHAPPTAALLGSRPPLPIHTHTHTPTPSHLQHLRLGGEAVGEVLQLRHTVRQAHRELALQELRREHELALDGPRAKVELVICFGGFDWSFWRCLWSGPGQGARV